MWLKTHDTPSVGGLVMIGPIAISQLMRAIPLAQVQDMCRAHLWLTHPDEYLAHICDAYVALINLLLFRETTAARDIIAAVASSSTGLHLPKLSLRNLTDAEVVGGMFSRPVIDDAWPSLLFLLYQYLDKPQQGLLANTNLGGENCHRGSVLGVLLGLATADGWDEQFAQLVDAQAIEQEINHLLAI